MSGPYDVLMIDPPWPVGLFKMPWEPGKTTGFTYDVLTIPAIFALLDADILAQAAPVHAVFLWTLDKFLAEAERLLEQRGYHRHARIIWDKGHGPGTRTPTLRIEHEYLLWYTRGGLLPIADGTAWRWASILHERTREHSRKPAAAYQMINAFYPTARKLDAFTREYRPGWDAYGDQVDHFTPLLAGLRTEHGRTG